MPAGAFTRIITAVSVAMLCSAAHFQARHCRLVLCLEEVRGEGCRTLTPVSCVMAFLLPRFCLTQPPPSSSDGPLGDAAEQSTVGRHRVPSQSHPQPTQTIVPES